MALKGEHKIKAVRIEVSRLAFPQHRWKTHFFEKSDLFTNKNKPVGFKSSGLRYVEH